MRISPAADSERFFGPDGKDDDPSALLAGDRNVLTTHGHSVRARPSTEGRTSAANYPHSQVGRVRP
jgi:hypothetical protein